MATTTTPRAARSTRRDVESTLMFVGIGAAVATMALAAIVPRLASWDVHLLTVPPLHADWDLRTGPGTIPAMLIAVVGVSYAARIARTARWSHLLLLSYALGIGWLVSLATVDGWSGIGHVLDTQNEYLDTARGVTSVHATLQEFVSRIPLDSAANWPVHVAGHPPGALLFFVGLVAMGVGSGLAAGWVVIVVAGTAPLAAMMTMRTLGAEALARRAAPFLVLAPAAIWMAVSADAVFAATAAWALAALAAAATSTRRFYAASWGVASGLLFGACVMMSYGLPLLALLGLAVLIAARTLAPLPWVLGAVAAVVVAFAAAGFIWWESYPVLHERYWDGIAQVRPFGYWVWGDLAALCFSAGPAVGAAIALGGHRAFRQLQTWSDAPRARQVRDGASSGSGLQATRVGCLLVVATVVTVLVADLSAMSKAEVERIWLPFVPWLLVGTAFLPSRYTRWVLALQVSTALLVQHLLFTNW